MSFLGSQVDDVGVYKDVVNTTIEKVDIGKKSARVQKTSFLEKSTKNWKTMTNIKKYKIYSFFSNF